MRTFLQLVVVAIDLLIIAWVGWIVFEVLRSRSIPPFIRTRPKVAEEVVDAFGALPPGSVVYDLGCGDGRTLTTIAKRNPAARCIGIEIRRLPYYLGRWKLWRRSVPNMRLVRGNMFEIDFSRATHVYTYLYPDVMAQLEPKFEKELNPGAVVVSLDFTFAQKQPARILALASYEKRKLGKTLYVYRF